MGRSERPSEHKTSDWAPTRTDWFSVYTISAVLKVIADFSHQQGPPALRLNVLWEIAPDNLKSPFVGSARRTQIGACGSTVLSDLQWPFEK